MYTLRRQFLPAVGLTIAFILMCCVAYPAATWVIGDVAFHSRITGSFVKSGGQVVGSKLTDQNFLDAHGNPLPQYFQPRPSDSDTSS